MQELLWQINPSECSGVCSLLWMSAGLFLLLVVGRRKEKKVTQPSRYKKNGIVLCGVAKNALLGTDSHAPPPTQGLASHRSGSIAPRALPDPSGLQHSVHKPAGWTAQIFINSMKAINNADFWNVAFFSTLILAEMNLAAQTAQNWFQAPRKFRHIQSQKFWRFCPQLVKPEVGESEDHGEPV